MSIEDRLREILGSEYGGPSVSFDNDKYDFIIYSWSDAPVGSRELACGKNLLELIEDYDRRREAERKAEVAKRSVENRKKRANARIKDEMRSITKRIYGEEGVE